MCNFILLHFVCVCVSACVLYWHIYTTAYMCRVGRQFMGVKSLLHTVGSIDTTEIKRPGRKHSHPLSHVTVQKPTNLCILKINFT